MSTGKLVDLRTRTPEERKRIATMGGKARGKQRRDERSMREWAKIIGGLKAHVVGPNGEALPHGNLDADAIMAQYRAAHNGSTKAATFLAKLRGEMTDEVAVKADGLLLQVGTQDEAQKIAEIINREQ